MSTNDTAVPDFDTARLRLEEVLSKNGIEGEVLWIFREDVSVRRGGKPWIRWPIPSTNRREAEELYEIGRRRGNGIELDVYCLLEGNPCCFVFIPKDKIEAEQRMIYGFKIFLPASLRDARRLGKNMPSRLAHFFSGREWPDWHLSDAPSRSANIGQS
jgi:hypothetical protein